MTIPVQHFSEISKCFGVKKESNTITRLGNKNWHSYSLEERLYLERVYRAVLGYERCPGIELLIDFNLKPEFERVLKRISEDIASILKSSE